MMRVHAVRMILLGSTIMCTLLLLSLTVDNRVGEQPNAERGSLAANQRRILAGRTMHVPSTPPEEFMFMRKTILDGANESIPDIHNAVDVRANLSISPINVGEKMKKLEKPSNDLVHDVDMSKILKKVFPDQNPTCRSQRALSRMENIYGGVFNSSLAPFLTLPSLSSKRLQQYPLPFGIKDLGGLVQNVLEKLPDTGLPKSVKKYPCRRCVVVGNGGLLKGSGLGHVIDSHHVVFRLNVAPIKGFEDDVGTKTTMRLMYPESSKLDDEEYAKNWTLVIIPFKKNDIDWTDYIIDGQSEHRVKPRGFWGPVATFVPKKRDEIRLLNPEVVTELSADLIGFKLGNGKVEKNVPTSGAMTIMIALRMCDEVSVAGFGYDTKKPDALIHYYNDEKMKMITASWTHGIGLERKMLRMLVTQGVIRDLTHGL